MLKQILKSCIFILSISCIGEASELTTLDGISTRFEESSSFVTSLKFNRLIGQRKINVNFVKDYIQVKIAQVKMKAESDMIHIGSDDINSVYTLRKKKTALETRIYLKGNASKYRGKVSIQRNGKEISITVAGVGAKILREKGPVVSEKISEKMPSKKIVEKAANQKLLQKEMKLEDFRKSSQGSSEALSLPKSDGETPLFKSATSKPEGSQESSYKRVYMSVAIIGLMSFGLFAFVRWWGKHQRPEIKNKKVKILTQHYLSPKKSLMIVRVAGESLLLGVTDHNISMLKTLSFIDDEMPTSLPNNFDESMESYSGTSSEYAKREPNKEALFVAGVDETHSSSDQMSPEDQRSSEEFNYGNIKDMISRKLKKMKDI